MNFYLVSNAHTLTMEGCRRPLSRWMFTSFNTRCRTIGSFTNLSLILLRSIYTIFIMQSIHSLVACRWNGQKQI